jgi:alcohol dehydrogenase class IV
MADGIALEGMRLIAEYLPRAVAEGADIEARTHMLLASSMGATAFQKGLGAVHAISHALGGKLNVHHGMANAIVLPYVMMLNRKDIEDRCAIVARHIGLSTACFDGLLQWTLEKRESLGVPHTLVEVDGMNEEMADELAPLALSDPALGGNPTPTRCEDLAATMKRALSGTLV